MLFHVFDQAIGPHIGPIFLDIREACGTGVRLMDDLPTVGQLDECGPERVLPLVVDQDMINSIFVLERVRHAVPPL